MHALQQELIVIALEVEDAFHPKNLVAEVSDHLTKPKADLEAIERPDLLNADCVDVLKMIVVVIALMVVMIGAVMMVVLVIIIAMFMMIETFELLREIDIANVENLRQVDLGVLRPLNLGDLV
jgi:hypothetical protein